MKSLLIVALGIMMLALNLNAYMNVTYLNTTVILNQNSSAHVVEVLNLYISNSSIGQYTDDRAAINLTLSDWQAALNTNLLVEHILNPTSSIYKFTFFPGPIKNIGTSGIAQLELNYYVRNVTTINETGPRIFRYTFNQSVFNFQHTASGQALPQNSQLNIILPQGAKIISLYPLPDYPQISFVGNLTDATFLSWHSGEPLAKFSLQFLLRQSLESEVISYFTGLYRWILSSVLEVLFILILIVLVYVGINNYLNKM